MKGVMSKEDERVTKSRSLKIQMLREQGLTEGERQAASAALMRVNSEPLIRITNVVLSIDTEASYYEVQYCDLHGRPVTRLLPRELFLRPYKVIEELLRVDANPWERRFARKLAIAGATAILLAELELAPWSERRATRAFERIYRRARSATVTTDEAAKRLLGRFRSGGHEEGVNNQQTPSLDADVVFWLVIARAPFVEFLSSLLIMG
jgi:hypothetical protein